MESSDQMNAPAACEDTPCVAATGAYPLRDYQVEALEQLSDHFFGARQARLLVHHPTGLGKTVLAASILQHPAFASWLASYPKGHRRVLFLAHRDELLQQAAEKFAAINGALCVDIHRASRRASPFADIVVGSVASLGRAGNANLRAYDPTTVRMVIVDEAHHAVAPSYLRVLSWFGLHPRPPLVSRAFPSRLLLGLTATPQRGDGAALGQVFDATAHSLPLLGMIDAGYLCRLRAYQVFTRVDIDAVPNQGGDFALAPLSRVVNVTPRNDAVVKACADFAANRKLLVFAVDVQHAIDLAEAFRRAGYAAEWVAGAMPDNERQRIIDAYREGQIDVLTNCMVLTEGFDVPDVSSIVLARPTQTPRSGFKTREIQNSVLVRGRVIG
jgi:ATP-dependent helicase IRC3